MELIEFAYVTSICCPLATAVQQGGEDYCLVDSDLSGGCHGHPTTSAVDNQTQSLLSQF